MITVPTEALAKAIGFCAITADRKTSLPILEMVMVEAENDLLRLTTTNLDLEASISVDAEIGAPAKFCVSCQRLNAVMRQIKSDNTRLDYDPEKQTLVIRGAGVSVKLGTIGVNEFPLVKTSAGKILHDGNHDDLAYDMTWLATARRPEDKRFIANVIRIHTDGSMICADGRRIHVIDTPLVDGGVNVACDHVRAISAILGLSESSTWEYDDPTLIISAGTASLKLRAVGEDYPSKNVIEWIMPPGDCSVLHIDVDGLKRSIEIPLALSNDDAIPIKIEAFEDGLKIVSTSKNFDFSDAVQGSVNESINISGRLLGVALKPMSGTLRIKVADNRIIAQTDGKTAAILRMREV